MLKKKKLVDEVSNLVVTNSNPSIVSEQFRTLRTNINYSPYKEIIKTLVITSAVKSEGKSTVAANLAVVYAQEGKKVLLVDGDMRRPTAHHFFQLNNNRGLSNFLKSPSRIEEVINQTSIDQLDLLSSGPPPSNPAELLASESFENLMYDVKKAYDIVIFDSPPLLAVTDGQIIATHCDVSLLVINSGVTKQELVVQARETLSLVNSQLIGVILNNFMYQNNPSEYQY